MSRSSIRIMLDQVQLCNLLDLTEALGASSAGRSYASCLQQLVEHVLKTSLAQGLIHPVSVEEASQRLNHEEAKKLTRDLKLEEFNMLPSELEAKKSTIKEKIEEALAQPASKDLDDLFK